MTSAISEVNRPAVYRSGAPASQLFHRLPGVFCLIGLLAPAHAGPGVWTQGLGLDNAVVSSLLAVPGVGIYAGTYGSGMFKSAYGGGSWSAVNNGIPGGTNVTSLTLAPNGSLFAGTQSGAFRSGDSGSSWTMINSGLTSTDINAIVADAAGAVYVATNGGGVLKTTNAGGNWVSVNTGLSAGFFSALAVDASSGVYTGAVGALFKTGNGGASWSAVGSGLPNVTVSALAVDPAGNVYAGTKGSGIFKSSNGGVSWVAVNNGLTNNAVTSLVADAAGGLYAGTAGGVFISGNGGGSWSALNNGLTTTYVNALAIDSNIIYAGTIGAGVFQYTPSAVIAPPFRITANVAGGNTALKLSANITVATADRQKTGNLYVVALLPNGALYALSPIGWLPVNPAMIQPFITVTLGTYTVPILDGSFDVSRLKGTTIFAGYGVDTQDMLSGSKFAAIYAIQ